MRRTQPRSRTSARRGFLVVVGLSLLVARDAPARVLARARSAADSTLADALRGARDAVWAQALGAIEVCSLATRAHARLRLYDPSGEVDEASRDAFERIASREAGPHRLAVRVEQLVFKAAYHFGARRVLIVSAWRENAGRHGSGDAVDFRLEGVRARDVARYLARLPRVGVGLYTNPATQFVHVDVRATSFHWIDASPPGVHWRERPLPDRRAAARDASYEPEMDLPI